MNRVDDEPQTRDLNGAEEQSTGWGFWDVSLGAKVEKEGKQRWAEMKEVLPTTEVRNRNGTGI